MRAKDVDVEKCEELVGGVNAVYHIFHCPWELGVDFSNMLYESCFIKASPSQQWLYSEETNDMMWNEKLYNSVDSEEGWPLN